MEYQSGQTHLARAKLCFPSLTLFGFPAFTVSVASECQKLTEEAMDQRVCHCVQLAFQAASQYDVRGCGLLLQTE